MVDDRKMIAKRYLKGWFIIDMVSIIPFDVLLQASFEKNYNFLIRFAKLGRLYKLIKLTRLLKLAKVVKESGKFMKVFSDELKVNPSIERLCFFILVLLMLCHIGACIWILFPQL
jgi:hypothetical protein